MVNLGRSRYIPKKGRFARPLPDERFIAGVAEASLILWGAATGKVLRKLEDHVHRSVAFSPDGKRLATCEDMLPEKDAHRLVENLFKLMGFAFTMTIIQ